VHAVATWLLPLFQWHSRYAQASVPLTLTSLMSILLSDVATTTCQTDTLDSPIPGYTIQDLVWELEAIHPGDPRPLSTAQCSRSTRPYSPSIPTTTDADFPFTRARRPFLSPVFPSLQTAPKASSTSAGARG
jgi:hypothetical protein